MAELAERMDTTFYLIFGHALLLSALYRGKVSEVLWGCIQCMFVGKDLLVADA
jgi:hypothetical protein